MAQSLERIGLVGDIHAEDQRLAAVLSYLRDRVEVVLAVGDIVDGEGDVDRCCALLADAHVIAVRGNHDRWFVARAPFDAPGATPHDAVTAATRSYLAALPATYSLETVAGRALLCHGLGDNDLKGLGSDDDAPFVRDEPAWRRVVADGAIRLVFNGHLHRRSVRVLDGIVVVNAGTLHHGDDPCFAVVDLAHRVVKYFDVEADGAIAPAEFLPLPVAPR